MPYFRCSVSGLFIAHIEAKDIDEAKRNAAKAWRNAMDNFNGIEQSDTSISAEFDFDDGTEEIEEEK